MPFSIFLLPPMWDDHVDQGCLQMANFRKIDYNQQLSPPHLEYSPLSVIFTHVLCSQLPTLTHVSRHLCTATQLALYSTLEFSAVAIMEAEACIPSLETAQHIAACVTSFSLSAYPPAHGQSFYLAL
jgi:hypothetical protein